MSYLILNHVITNVINDVLPKIFATTVLISLFNHSMEEVIVILLLVQNMKYISDKHIISYQGL